MLDTWKDEKSRAIIGPAVEEYAELALQDDLKASSNSL